MILEGRCCRGSIRGSGNLGRSVDIGIEFPACWGRKPLKEATKNGMLMGCMMAADYKQVP